MRPLLHTIWFGSFIIWPIIAAFVALKVAERRSVRGGRLVGAARTRLAGAAGIGGPRHGAWSSFKAGSSGNTAFDEWRAAELSRLEGERGQLETKYRDFAEYVDNLRRAKDRETFERFMNAFTAVRHPASGSSPPRAEEDERPTST